MPHNPLDENEHARWKEALGAFEAGDGSAARRLFEEVDALSGILRTAARRYLHFIGAASGQAPREWKGALEFSEK